MKAHCDSCIKYQKIYDVVIDDNYRNIKFLCADCHFKKAQRDYLNRLKYKAKKSWRTK